ncbi:zinc finger (ccch type) motif-containing protein [Cystoisospora suis]|uniref:Zinc finger (Ccch type) motif-containing protein n=1 Tax=Cystoisospora suis TaxID=483139 RepID=A0A2C6L6J9_9APIC|nr:zinc finger (ccch type) motif-containing protein [Cystoisospora suis]
MAKQAMMKTPGEESSFSSASPSEFFELRCLDTLALESEPRTMTCVEGVLFVGLQLGLIKAFMTNGEIKELKRHTGAVECLLLIDDVLVSGSWDGLICMWRYEANAGFLLVKELQISGNITCLKEISYSPDISSTPGSSLTAPTASMMAMNGGPASMLGGGGAAGGADLATAASQPKRLLWVGGTVLSIVDLHCMQIINQVPLNTNSPPPSSSSPSTVSGVAQADLHPQPNSSSSSLPSSPPCLVLALVQYEKSVLAGFNSGSIRAYSPIGEEQFRYDDKANHYLSTMEGVLSPSGPLLVYGGLNGVFHALKLPEFQGTQQTQRKKDKKKERKTHTHKERQKE